MDFDTNYFSAPPFSHKSLTKIALEAHTNVDPVLPPLVQINESLD